MSIDRKVIVISEPGCGCATGGYVVSERTGGVCDEDARDVVEALIAGRLVSVRTGPVSICGCPHKAPPPPAAARPEEVECDTCGGCPSWVTPRVGDRCTRFAAGFNETIACPGTLRAKAAPFFSAEERLTRQNAREAVAAWREWWTPRWTRKVDEQESMTAFLAGWATKELRAKAQAVRLVCGTCGFDGGAPPSAVILCPQAGCPGRLVAQ